MEKTELFVCRCHDVSHQLVLETLKTEDFANKQETQLH
mgnify:FL=1